MNINDVIREWLFGRHYLEIDTTQFQHYCIPNDGVAFQIYRPTYGTIHISGKEATIYIEGLGLSRITINICDPCSKEQFGDIINL